MWLKSKKFKGFLGEFAGGNNPQCQRAVKKMLDAIEAQHDVWVGWSWWAAGAGPWDGGCTGWWANYRFSLRPTCTRGASNNVTAVIDAPQFAWLQPYLSKS